MKKALIYLIALLSGFSLQAQVDWNYSNNPVLHMDTLVQWESMGQPSVIIHDDTMRMWYAVAGGATPTDTIPRGRIHYAWSTDGQNWTKHPGNPVLDVGGAGQWDGEWLDTPEVLWDGSQYLMYYYGDSTYFQGQANTALGLATSPDGINWTRQGKVLERGAPGDWDGKFIESPACYLDPVSGVHAMWYTGIDTVGFTRIGLAVSPDGMNWIKAPSNPGLIEGSFGEWDDMFVAVPAVIESDGIFEMWYSGVSYVDQWDSVFIGYATSLDGQNWVKYPGNPVLMPNPGDSAGFWAVDVVWDSLGNVYRMYYENVWKADAGAVYPATSPRTVLFSQNCATSISPDTNIWHGDSASLWASGGTIYQWTPVEGLSDPTAANPMASPDSTTTYDVMIVSDSCITRESVTVNVMLGSGIAETEAFLTVKLYPNPSRGLVNVELPLGSPNSYRIRLRNALGMLVAEFEGDRSGKTRMDVSGLPAGFYSLDIVEGSKVLGLAKLIIR